MNKYCKSAAIIPLALSFFITAPALADTPPVPTLDNLHNQGATIPDTAPAQTYPESAYTLTEIENADPDNLPQNAITLYDKNEDGTVTPKYYLVNLKDSVTNIGSGDTTKYFEWSQNTDTGNLELKEVSTPTEGNTTITYSYNSDSFTQKIEGQTINNPTVTNPSNTYSNPYIFNSGAGLNNPEGRKDSIDNVLYIGNKVTGTLESTTSSYKYAQVSGGAVYNAGELTSVTGLFINNSVEANTTGDYSNRAYNYAYGGALYNSGTIGDITGDFIGNYASGNSSAEGGAIYNDRTIGDITGDFIGNYSTGSFAQGGAIYNDDDAEIGDITGDFIGNYASSIYGSAYGGAIYNDEGTIGDITGDFIGNYASSTNNRAYGGAIYNNDGAEIGNITGDFIGNYASGNTSAYGGAIYNSNATIGNITGDFIGNYAISENDYAYGGAIYNSTNSSSSTATIGSITGDFVGNYASSTTRDAYGGAIVNAGTIGDITGDFIGNYAYSTSGFAMGGAIANTGTIMGYDVSSDKIYDISQLAYKVTNPNTGESFVLYGLNDAEIQETNALLEQGYKIVCNPINYPQMTPEEWAEFEQELNAYIESGELRTELPFGDDAFAKESGSFINSSFINNYAESKNGNAAGGAIFSINKIHISADNGQSIFSGNKTISNGVEEQNAIGMYGLYVSEELSQEEGIPAGFLDPLTGSTSNKNTANLTLEAKNNGIIVFDDTIRGGGIDYQKFVVEDRLELIETPETAFDLKVTGDSTGKVILNNDVINANISLDNTNLYLGREDVFDQSQSLTLNSGSIYLNNQSIGTMHVLTLNLNGNTNISVDADLANKSMDRITADNYNITNDAKLNVNNVVLLSDAKEDVTNILFADKELASNVAYTGVSPIAYSPIYKYEVTYNPDDGFFTFSRGGGASSGSYDAYNPAIMASSVATQAGAYTTQLQTFNFAFQHADTFMNIPYLERLSIIQQGKYALSPTGDATDVGTYSPLMIKQHDPGFWVKPYASFENVPLKNGPKVSNINYGTLIGYDTPIKEISNGFERVLTGYIGYNGASQRYSGVDAYQNGGLIGGTATFYKGNFFNATTLSVGATAGDASTMYGSENYTMLLAGIGNKTGYNFEFWDGKMILQPNFLISYTFVNTFDYNNAAGVRIESDPLHAIQLSPGLKLIGNTKNGWQPYIGVNMVWNLLDDSRVTANDVRLPEMSIRPYVQYGVGIQKRFKDKFLAFGQAMIHNGGRNGVSLTAGLRWKVGRE